jgi:hypothetical protein
LARDGMTADFEREAERFLRRHAMTLLRDWLEAPAAGTWHPNGFAVFHLGEVDHLGRLRLHAWPSGQRIALEGQPAVHSHPWDLCSLVLTGRYQDVIYEAREVFPNEGKASEDHLQRFELELGEPGAGDRVYPVDRWFAPVSVDTRGVTAGDVHQLPAGRLHRAIIPPDEFVATLVLTSQPRGEVQLLGNGSFGDRTYVRPPVSREGVASIKAHLRAEAVERAG